METSSPKMKMISLRPVEAAKTGNMKMDRGPVTEAATGEWLEKYRSHLLDREYMSGIERDIARVKATAEVFTPDFMVKKLVKKMGVRSLNNPRKFVLDPACGDGQFLAYILYCRLKRGVPLLEALKTIHGIEFMEDNASRCRERLRCGHGEDSEVGKLVAKNIVTENALKYHMRFDETPGDDQMNLPLKNRATGTSGKPSK